VPRRRDGGLEKESFLVTRRLDPAAKGGASARGRAGWGDCNYIHAIKLLEREEIVPHSIAEQAEKVNRFRPDNT